MIKFPSPIAIRVGDGLNFIRLSAALLAATDSTKPGNTEQNAPVSIKTRRKILTRRMR